MSAPYRYIPLLATFWDNVLVGEEDECWLWQRSCFPTTGYGQVNSRVDGKWAPTTAHRVAYELVNGPVAPGMEILHTCDNRPCCNPRHLVQGPHSANAADMVAKGRQSRGEHRPLSKLTEKDVKEIRESTLPQKVLAEKFGVHQSAISKIKNRLHWRHI